VAEAGGDGLRKFATVLATPEADVGVRSLEKEDGAKGVACGERAELQGREAGGVETADQRAHAGASQTVDWDVMVLKPLKDADVRKAERTTTLKGESDGRSSGRSDGGQFRMCGRLCAGRRAQKRDQ
jgi:hypothetical protein